MKKFCLACGIGLLFGFNISMADTQAEIQTLVDRMAGLAGDESGLDDAQRKSRAAVPPRIFAWSAAERWAMNDRARSR